MVVRNPALLLRTDGDAGKSSGFGAAVGGPHILHLVGFARSDRDGHGLLRYLWTGGDLILCRKVDEILSALLETGTVDKVGIPPELGHPDRNGGLVVVVVGMALLVELD